MKKLLVVLVLGVGLNSYSQKNVVNVNQIYDDIESLTVIDTVLNVDSVTFKELKNRFNNWGGINYNNYKNVKTSETDNQVVIDYITSSFGVLKMNVRLVAYFKNNKVRLKVTDMGNVYTYQASPAIPIQAKTCNIKSYFYSNNQISYKVKPGMFNYKEKQATGSINYRREIVSTISSINKGLLINNNEVVLSDDNW